MLSKGFNYLTKWKKINQRVLLLTNNNIGLEIFKRQQTADGSNMITL